MLKGLKTFNPAEIEEKVLEFWKKNQIFEKSLKQRRFSGGKKSKIFKFYEGPPTANGRPGIHHVLARVFKDIILRYKSMRGFYVPRKAGWDTQGLPIEIEAEKQLGIKNKKEIEKFGIALFNQKAKEAVWKYKDEWEKMTERIGYWLDLKNVYITYENSYIESCWWIFQAIAKRGYLKKSYKVVPYCPRCETPLASHELGMPEVYKKVSDPSVFVKFRLKKTSGQSPVANTYLLVWTTTPWTLPSNVAVAVDPKLTYTKFSVARGDGKKEYLWSHNPPPEDDGEKIEVVEKVSGQRLVGLGYEPLYKNSQFAIRNSQLFKVLPADFILTEEGTGLVHIAPAFGEDDLGLIKSSFDNAQDKQFDWQTVPVTVDDAGKVKAGYPGAGKFIKSADKDIIADLEVRGLMYKSTTLEHEYPFCWRCSAPLIYFARLSWFFEVSRLRQELVQQNKKINWIPGHIKDGRFGEWIKEAKDWAISRDRYWGTPLPIWECSGCKEIKVVGSLGELTALAYSKNNFFFSRHGEATSNVRGLIASGPEKGAHVSELTAKGMAETERLAAFLSKRKINVIYTSPYKRTKQTASVISKKTGARVIVDRRLAELDCGVFNWQPIKEHGKFFQNSLDRFVKAPPGGESLLDLKKRTYKFLKEVNDKHDDKNIVVVSHGDPLWMMEAMAKGLSNEASLKLPYFKNGEIKEIKLANVPRNETGEIDMHRPFVDHVFLRCVCGGKMTRVRGVADVWFDSGAVPLASYHWPFSENQKSKVKSSAIGEARQGRQKLPDAYPADYICEAIDQTRGWFYSMLALSTLLGNERPYKNVICLGLILDKNGVKMSKSKGNVVDPWEVMGKYGVDAVRWYFYTVNPPGEPKQFDEAEVGKTMRRIFLILYNAYVFFETYGKTSKDVRQFRALPNSKNILDKWIVARKDSVILATYKFLDNYDIGSAAKEIESLLDDLSRWYIRRSRRRFQKPSSEKDLLYASKTLEHVLFEMSRLLAPFVPFFSEALYKSLAPKGMAESVHLTDWPEDKLNKKADKTLIDQMQWVREVATKALAKRAEAGVKVRQPLQSVSIKHLSFTKTLAGKQVLSIKLEKEVLEILKDEINVKEIIFDDKLKEEMILDIRITPDLKEEGIIRDLVRAVQELRQNAGYTQKNKIELFISSAALNEVVTRHQSLLKKEVGAKNIYLKRSEKFDAEIMTKLDDQEIWLAVKKVRD